MATTRKTSPVAGAEPDPETRVDPPATTGPGPKADEPDSPDGVESETKPDGAEKSVSGRRLAHAVYVTDDEGRTKIYQPGDVPAPEHAEKIGDHAYEPPVDTLPLHPHSREFDAQVTGQVGQAPKLAVMEAR